MTTEKDGQLNVSLDEETAQGTYTNLALVSHSAEEFILDFIRVMPGVPSHSVKARIIITPPHRGEHRALRVDPRADRRTLVAEPARVPDQLRGLWPRTLIAVQNNNDSGQNTTRLPGPQH